jgi:hypothetical protein
LDSELKNRGIVSQSDASPSIEIGFACHFEELICALIVEIIDNEMNRIIRFFIKGILNFESVEQKQDYFVNFATNVVDFLRVLLKMRLLDFSFNYFYQNPASFYF